MNDSEKLFELGKSNYLRGNLLDAADCFEKSVACDQASAIAYSNLLLTLNYLPSYDANTLFQMHREFDARYCQPLAQYIPQHTNTPSLNRPLKIGYVSPDLRGHSVAFFIAPVLMRHDREQFEIYAYYNHPNMDNISNKLHQFCHRWKNIADLPDEKVAEIIREDGIDILIDLAGHSAHNRLLVFARKPAPIQVTWLGYPNTTGLSAIDFRITDNFADMEGVNDEFYSESLIRVPEIFLCYSPLRECPIVSPLPALKNKFMTFGSFNNFAKINPDVISSWIKLLRKVPESRLHLIFNGGHKAWLDDAIRKARSSSEVPLAALRAMGNFMLAMNAFETSKIKRNRVSIHGRSTSNTEHLQRYNAVDISLDAFPYNGTTTSCESLWMGVPVITIKGNRHVSRVSSSIVKSIGMPDLAVESEADLVAVAKNLARDKSQLAAIRGGLRAAMSASPLMNAAKFTSNLEREYKSMWKDWCENR